MFDLNAIKEALYTEHGRKYTSFFGALANMNSSNKTYSLMTTNRKGVNFLLNYYRISKLDMKTLFDCIAKDVDIRDMKSELFVSMSRVVNATWNSGESTEQTVYEDLMNNPKIKSVKKTGGFGSRRDMIDKVDIECILGNGKQCNIQVKPYTEMITDKDRNSDVDVFAFVRGKSVRYEKNK